MRSEDVLRTIDLADDGIRREQQASSQESFH